MISEELSFNILSINQRFCCVLTNLGLLSKGFLKSEMCEFYIKNLLVAVVDFVPIASVVPCKNLLI